MSGPPINIDLVGPGAILAKTYATVASAAAESAQAAADEVSALAAQLLALGYRYNFVETPTTFTDTSVLIDHDSYIQTSTFARAIYQTAATQLRIHGYSDIVANYPQYAEIGVISNGVHVGSVSPTANGLFFGTVTLPAGSKTIQIVNGLQSDIPPLRGTYVVTIEADAPLLQQFPAATNRVVFLVDSIGVGGNSDTATRDAYVQKLREVTTDSLVVYGWGSNHLYGIAGDSTKRSALVAILTALAPTRIVNTLGTNDYGLSAQSAANFQTSYAALNDAIHAALPSAQIFAVTPLSRVSETSPNSFSNTLADYRTAVTAAAAGKSWVTVVDGTSFMTTAEMADGLHPTTHGHLLWAKGIDGYLGYTVPDAVYGPNPLNVGPDANGTVTSLGGGVYRATKTTAPGGGGPSAFNSGFYGQLHAGDFRIQLDAQDMQHTMIGVNATPHLSSAYQDMAHQLYITDTGLMYAYDGAAQTATIPTTGYVPGDGSSSRFWVDRTGSTLTFKQGAAYTGGTVLRTVSGVVGSIALDLSMATLNARMDVHP
jgi:lysophospholipase L1-like esterase